jgi:hypothetical protein
MAVTGAPVGSTGNHWANEFSTNSISEEILFFRRLPGDARITVDALSLGHRRVPSE